MAVIDWANKLNYSVDALVIGAFLNTSAVAVWSVGQRLAELTQRLTNQLNDVLFPAVVDNDTAARHRSAADASSSRARGCRWRRSSRWRAPDADGRAAGPGLGRAANSRAACSSCSCWRSSVIVRVGNADRRHGAQGRRPHRLVAVTNVGAALCQSGAQHCARQAARAAGRRDRHALPVGLASVAGGVSRRRAAAWSCRSGARLSQAVWPAVWPAVDDGRVRLRDAAARSARRSSRSASEMRGGRARLRGRVRALRPERRANASSTCPRLERRCASQRRLQPVSEGA